MASSTEEVSGANNDLSGGSRRDDEQFGVFKDFDFLEYESESIEVSVAIEIIYIFKVFLTLNNIFSLVAGREYR